MTDGRTKICAGAGPRGLSVVERIRALAAGLTQGRDGRTRGPPGPLSELPELLDPARYTGAAGALAGRVLDRYAKGTPWT
ncbi:hypothetical protein C1703_20670 [Streptomyces sp. Go-475]|nr:hypothetical protein C1703_20670 [Streptomyces sp. Go-475]